VNTEVGYETQMERSCAAVWQGESADWLGADCAGDAGGRSQNDETQIASLSGS
jgi:hypothetical protein